jgi:hypothetical protein
MLTGSLFHLLPMHERTRSFAGNNLGDAGVCALAEALKSNAALTFLECVVVLSFFLFFGSTWHTHSLAPFPPPRTRSLGYNNIGTEGARAIAEALKSNATLRNFKCVSSLNFLLCVLTSRAHSSFRTQPQKQYQRRGCASNRRGPQEQRNADEASVCSHSLPSFLPLCSLFPLVSVHTILPRTRAQPPRK